MQALLEDCTDTLEQVRVGGWVLAKSNTASEPYFLRLWSRVGRLTTSRFPEYEQECRYCSYPVLRPYKVFYEVKI